MRLSLLLTALLVASLPHAAFADVFALRLQRMVGETKPTVTEEQWPAAETAFIVCDVWDAHHSLNAVKRLEEFAPRMNEVLKEARRRGATIIHSPSDCMPAYAEHPARQRVLELPAAAAPLPGIDGWVSQLDTEGSGPFSALYPVDQSDGGEDDDPAEHAAWAEKLAAMGRNPGMPWKMQSPLIEIDVERDYISDKGGEVWNVLEARGIEFVVLVGVHTNMCVIGRPFGLRQMARQGKHVVHMRDMTDCMYNPTQWPRVDHFTGNDLVTAYIERYVCPTITSDQILGGEPFRFAGDTRTTRALPELPARDAAKEWTQVAGGALLAGWYRCAVQLPCAGSDDALSFEVPKLLDVAGVWIDGTPLEGSPTGGYSIPASLRVSGDPVWLVMYIKTGARTNGCNMSIHCGSASESLSIPLYYTWQLRTDEGDFSRMPLPAKFGAAPDNYFDFTE